VLTYHRGAPSFRRSDLRVDFFGAASVIFSRRWKLARPVFSCALLTSWFSLPGELRAPVFCFVRRARNRCALSSFLVPRSRSSVPDQIRFLPSAPRNSPGARVSCSSARSAHAAREFSQHPVLVPFSLRSSLQFRFLLRGILRPDFVFLFSSVLTPRASVLWEYCAPLLVLD
jgi:hypothetical protein